MILSTNDTQESSGIDAADRTYVVDPFFHAMDISTVGLVDGMVVEDDASEGSDEDDNASSVGEDFVIAEFVRKKSGDGTHGECPDETVTMPEDQAKGGGMFDNMVVKVADQKLFVDVNSDNGPDRTTVDYVKAGKAMEDPIVDGDEYVKAGKAMEDAAYGGDVSAAQSSPLDSNGCSTGIKNKEVHAYNKEIYRTRWTVLHDWNPFLVHAD